MTGTAISSSPNEDKNIREVVENGPVTPARGKIIDLVLPILLLIAFCIWGLVRNGYQSLGGEGSVIDAFSETGCRCIARRRCATRTFTHCKMNWSGSGSG